MNPERLEAVGTPPRTVAGQVVDALAEAGVDVVFGIPGGAVAPLYAAVMHRPGIRLITAKHETGAMFMCLGYSIATGKPGAVFTTAGPGITNALTGLASAYYEGVPVVHIAGEVPRGSFGRGALQESSAWGLDAMAMTRSITRFSAQLMRPGSVEGTVRKALAAACGGRRGPVFLSLPLDVAAMPAEATANRGQVRSAHEVDTEACFDAARMLGGAARPLILAGAGCRSRTNRAALRRLAERLGAPVAVTCKGKGVFPEDHPLYLGLFGFGGHDSVTKYLLEGVDVVMVCGSGLNDFSTNAWSPLLRPRNAMIQIDIDPSQLGRNYPIHLGLVGPVDVVIPRLLEAPLPDLSRSPASFEPALQRAEPSRRGLLTICEVVQAMNEVCPRDSFYTADMGEHLSIALHYLRVREEGDFLACLGFGSMGSGICAAIGHQIGAPSRPTFAICGDGGFLMYGNELTTAVQHGAATTFVVINDSRLNMVHHGMCDLYGASPDFSTQEIDFAAFARTLGAAGELIRTREQLTSALARKRSSPVVLDVRVDPDVRLGGSQRDAALRQFTDAPHE